MPTVRIVIERGAVQNVEAPANIKVVILDYDVEGVFEDHLQADANGKQYIESIWPEKVEVPLFKVEAHAKGFPEPIIEFVRAMSAMGAAKFVQDHLAHDLDKPIVCQRLKVIRLQEPDDKGLVYELGQETSFRPDGSELLIESTSENT
jgi:hypothetical protein